MNDRVECDGKIEARGFSLHPPREMVVEKAERGIVVLVCPTCERRVVGFDAAAAA